MAILMWLTPTLSPHLPIYCVWFFFFSGVPVKLLTTDQSSQAFLCREHDLSGKKKAAVIALSCPRSSYRVPTPLFNQRSFLVSFQLCYPQNYPVIIKSYHFSIVQVSVSLVVFQSLFTWALPNTYSLFHNPLPPLFSPAMLFTLLTAIPGSVQSSLCHSLLCVPPVRAWPHCFTHPAI